MKLDKLPIEIIYTIYEFTIFVPKNNKQLYDAIDIWFANYNNVYSTVLEKLGPMSLWDTKNITDMSYLFSMELKSAVYNSNDKRIFTIKRKRWIETMETSAGHSRANNDTWIIHSNNDKRERIRYYENTVNNFNEDISNWNVSNVTNMEYMFENAKYFNQNISKWNVSNVKNMNWMFLNAENFNQPIGNWKVSSVKSMTGMFSGAKNFNQEIGQKINKCHGWDMKNVKNTSYMFHKAFIFNKYIGDWNVTNVEDMHSMFDQAHCFNSDIRKWDVSKVKDISFMLSCAQKFQHVLDCWKLFGLPYDEYGNIDKKSYFGLVFYNHKNTTSSILGDALKLRMK